MGLPGRPGSWPFNSGNRVGGKFRARDALLNAVPRRGDEPVLDVRCGHGLMLIGAAKRLSSGGAIGIDIRQDVDQANNSAAATRRNAELEGVSVDVRDGDARGIPFDVAAFDVVVSSLVLHNIYSPREREQALGESARVLKPGATPPSSTSGSLMARCSSATDAQS